MTDKAPSGTAGNDVRPLLEVQDLVKHFGPVRAVDGISITVEQGHTLGLVGESGCGKSSAGRAILQLHRPTSGSVRFDGQELTTLSERDTRRMRRHMQMIFQDPFASLNPKMTVGDIVAEPIVIHRLLPRERRAARVRELFDLVGLPGGFVSRYAHEFSGGQRQRIGIARALAAEPRLLVCDEPVSALDVSIQAQIINLLEDLQRELDLTYLFIAHDLSVVRHISDQVAVMYLGRIVEIADRNTLYENPCHPYTKALLSAVPIADPIVERSRERIILKGDLPSPAAPPSGCRFRTRCPAVMPICVEVAPVTTKVAPGHHVECHLFGDAPTALADAGSVTAKEEG